MNPAMNLIVVVSIGALSFAGSSLTAFESAGVDASKVYEARTYIAPEGPYKDSPLPYRLLVPEGCDPKAKDGKRWPLILFLHGAGERGRDNLAQLKYFPTDMASAENRAKYPCFILAPQCPPQRAWSARNLQELLEGSPAERSEEARAVLGALDSVLAEMPVDPDRVYLTGLSMGGFGSFYLAARYPERWAAVVPICGGGNPDSAARMKSIPFWIFHGGKDPVVAPELSRRMVEALKRAGASVRYTEFPDAGHDSWTPGYRHPGFLPWLFAQRRGAAAEVGVGGASSAVGIEGDRTALAASTSTATGGIRLDGASSTALWSDPRDSLTWRVRSERDSVLDLSITYAAAKGGGIVEASCGDSHVAGEVLATGDAARFATLPLGLISVPKGNSEIVLRAKTRPEGADEFMSLREVVLESGFVSLFDGKTLAGWEGSVDGYEATDGVITCKAQGGGFLYTKDEYSDFDFRFQFIVPPGGNNGVGIRAERGKDAAYHGFEIQVLDDPSYEGQIQDWQRHGSIYGIVPAEPGHLRAAGEWNVEEIVARGRRITVRLNGATIVDANVDEAMEKLRNGTKEEKDRARAHEPGVAMKKGYICFCGHGSAVRFRDIRVKDLSEK